MTQGLITLDFGNSHPHAGIFLKSQQAKWQLKQVIELSKLDQALSQWQLRPDNSSVVLAQVRARPDELKNLYSQGYLVTLVKDYWRGTRFAGMPVNYSQTLGEDRLITAWHVFRQKHLPALLIDAGTFVTMDLISEEGFLGGHILPGLENYFNCFQQGEQLQNHSLNAEWSWDLPQSTPAALRDSYLAFGHLAQKLIEKYGAKYLYLSGKDGEHWQYLKAHNPQLVLHPEPHLVHLALQNWYTTQIELL